MTCNNCDKTNDDDANYCVHCGNQFKEVVITAGELIITKPLQSVAPADVSITSSVVLEGSSARDLSLDSNNFHKGLLVAGLYYSALKVISILSNTIVDYEKAFVLWKSLALLDAVTPFVIAFFAQGKIRIVLGIAGVISLFYTIFRILI